MAIAFRVFGIPVRVQAWFWLIALVLWQGDGGWGRLLLWVAVVFQAVLFHELGHALVGRRFGRSPRIELTLFGGMTWWRDPEPLTPGRRVLVSLAGPFVGIGIGVLAALVSSDPRAVMNPALSTADPTIYALGLLFRVNLVWGVLNLLPVLPLDGGNVVAAIAEFVSPGRGRLIACFVSFAVLAPLLVLAGINDLHMAVIFIFAFAFIVYQIYRGERERIHALTHKPPLTRAFEALEAGDAATVIGLAATLISDANGREELDEAFHLLAWGRLLNGEADEADQALRSISGERDPDPALRGAVLVELGRYAEALPLLRRASAQGGQFVERYLERAKRGSLAPDEITP